MYDRLEPEISVNLLFFMELKLRTVKRGYIFKKVDGVDIEATVHWKAPWTEAESSYGISVSDSC